MSEIRAGEILAGKYRVERVLGSGGMGFVVAARHLHLEQLVALKFIKEGVLENDEAIGRFLREARAVARLKNEHVARVLDVGTLESGAPYMVMEYLEGTDLHALAKERGTVSVEEASEYVLQACEALAEAHAQHIIHRDIKPANLFLTKGPAGRPLVKVLDFGISKANPLGTAEQEMTTTAAMLGSPRFMSPEQMVDAHDVDERTDIWSLGVVLYRLVTGKLPFDAPALGALLKKVMNEATLPPSKVVHVPAGFDEVVLKCLAKDVDQRYRNVLELARELALFAPPRARACVDEIALHIHGDETMDRTPPGLSPGTPVPEGAVRAVPPLAATPLPLPESPAGASPSPSLPLGDTDAPWTGTMDGHRRRSPVGPLLLFGFGLVASVAAGVAVSRSSLVRTPSPTAGVETGWTPPRTESNLQPGVASPIVRAVGVGGDTSGSGLGTEVEHGAPVDATSLPPAQAGEKIAGEVASTAPRTTSPRSTTPRRAKRPAQPHSAPPNRSEGIPSTRD